MGSLTPGDKLPLKPRKKWLNLWLKLHVSRIMFPRHLAIPASVAAQVLSLKSVGVPKYFPDITPLAIFADTMIPHLFILLISWAVVAETQPTGISGSVPQSTACGDIIHRTAPLDERPIELLNASEVFACFSTVPFNPAVASRFVKYFNDTIQFHSTLAYLRHPPKGYQQPAVDLVHELGVIQGKIDQGYYRNEYQFEEAVQRLIYSAHDKHLRLNAGVLSAFRFESPWSVVSLSSDGKQTPRLYLFSTHDYFLSPIPTLTG